MREPMSRKLSLPGVVLRGALPWLASAALAVNLPSATSATAAPATPQIPRPISTAAAGDVALAAGAGNYMSFLSPEGGPIGPPLSGFGSQLRKLFGVGPLDAKLLARVGIDRRRPIVVSLGIVDPARLRELMTSPRAPSANTPFIIRTMVVVPVLDPARAEAALGDARDEPSCVRPRGDPARLRLWTASVLQDPADLRTAEASDAAYLCAQDDAGVVVRANMARRELRWVLAKGGAGALRAAAAPVPLARELSDQLQADGFFSARTAMFNAPAENARLATATYLIKIMAGIGGVDASQRDRLWQKGVHEVGAIQRLIDSPPALFSGLLAKDGVLSWMLTKEGRAFFAALPGRPTNAKTLKSAIAKKLKPGGVFSDGQQLADAIHEAGSSGELVVRQMLWPHLIAIEAAHPGGPATDFDDDGAEVEIDAEAGRVRLHVGGAR